MKTPTFAYMGGKARLRSWLLDYFPKEGNIYLEPFVGLGNVFYASKQKLTFNLWHINDINAAFFKSLLVADLDQLPATVDKEDFKYWKNANNDISRIIEPRISYTGKGYSAGFGQTHKTHTGYRGDLYKTLCNNARQLLQGVTITNDSWDQLPLQELNYGDFVYCDPPYHETKSSYPNINHEHFIDAMNDAKFRWAISGYKTELYSDKLKYKNEYVRTRNSEIKSLNTAKYHEVKEYLWTNY